MTDKYTTKELIEFLGDTIDYLGLYSPDKDGMIHTGFTVNQITKLKRIREILELQAQPDEELVEELLNLFSERAAWILSSAFDCSIPEPEALEDKIRSLLQSRQPVVTGCVITQGEFLEFCGEIQRRFTDEKDGQRYFLLGAGIQMYCEDWLKSKGVEVEEKP